MRIPIFFGWINIHRKEQLLYCKKPLLVIHWNQAKWLEPYFEAYSKRLLCVGRKDRDES